MGLKEAAAFVAKSVRIKNNKKNDYYLYRLTIPKEIVKTLDLKGSEHLLVNLKKAEWYHLLDWSKMDKAWDMLPDKVKGEVLSLGFPTPIGQVSPAGLNIASDSNLSRIYNSASSTASITGTIHQTVPGLT
jgi:hypothetical protein